MKSIEDLTFNEVHELITYNQDSGITIKNKRDIKWFEDSKNRSAQWACNNWNSRHAGKPITNKLVSGHLVFSLFNESVGLHRLIWFYMTGEWPKGDIDHINGDPSDNRWCNLRDVSHAENSRNQKLRSTNKTGTMGVYLDRRNNKWYGQIRINDTKIFLGYFNTKEEAVTARKIAEIEYGFCENHGRIV